MARARRPGSSIELVVFGLLAALVVVLAVPLFSSIPETPNKQTEPTVSVN